MFQIDISGSLLPEFGVILISFELAVDSPCRTHSDRCKGDATLTVWITHKHCVVFSSEPHWHFSSRKVGTI